MGGRGSSSPKATGTSVKQRVMTGGASGAQVQQRMHGTVMSTTDTSGERQGPAVVGASHTLDEVRAMSDTQFVKYVRGLENSVSDSELMSHGAGLDNGTVTNYYAPGPREADFQRFLYDTGANGRPNVVSSQHFQQMDGDTIYRTVTTSSSVPGDTATVRADRIINGERTATGRGIYGAGLYFADSKSDSKRYGSSVPGNSAIVRAKLNQNARSVTETSLSRMLNKESATVRSAFQDSSGYGFKSEARKSIYALWKGYNVIDINGRGYYTVLDRRALTVSDGIETW